MKHEFSDTNRFQVLVSNLCFEIDELRAQRDFWKDEYEKERDARNMELNESLERSKQGIGRALMFALSVKDNPDGSLSINKEDREMLADSLSTNS